jgi:hypothetical protein
MILLFLPESPNFLLKKQKNQELRSGIQSICNANGLTQENSTYALRDLDEIIERAFFFIFGISQKLFLLNFRRKRGKTKKHKGIPRQ